MKSYALALLLVTVVALSLTGCVVALGNREADPPARIQPTTGEQLIDLKKAHDAGALTDAEYEAQKERFLQGKKK